VTMTPSTDCSTMQWKIVENGCGSCGDPSAPVGALCVNNGAVGKQSCSSNAFTVTRK
jgi:hypothetical protein